MEGVGCAREGGGLGDLVIPIRVHRLPDLLFHEHQEQISYQPPRPPLLKRLWVFGGSFLQALGLRPNVRESVFAGVNDNKLLPTCEERPRPSPSTQIEEEATASFERLIPRFERL